MTSILDYLTAKYAPLSIILYGSYADGTNGLSSDFDALVISAHSECHDTSFVNAVPLDVFVYPASRFQGALDCEAFLQLYDGKLLLDRDGTGQALLDRIRDYWQTRPRKTPAQLQSDLDWCIKMLARAQQQDAEGMFRWHWLLTDSLEIYFDRAGQPYPGPKKALRWMRSHAPDAFCRYEEALRTLTPAALTGWIACLQSITPADPTPG